MRTKFRAASFCVITLLFPLIISQRAIVGEEQQWQAVPEANYADILELIALRAKVNYEEIASWQGRMDILETNHYYGPKAAKLGDVDKDSFGRNSQHIFEEIKSTGEFVVDLRNDKLYSKKGKPHVELKALDLDPNKLLRKGGKYVSVRAILSPDLYMWYMPDSNFGSKLHNVRAGKTVFIDRPEERKFSLSGDIRDPRLFFESSGEDGKKLWESLLRIRKDINDRIKERIAGFPHMEISFLERDSGTKYRVLTTWKGGEDYYIRSLLEVDEAVGLNAIKTETTNPDSVKTASKEYTYEKIGEIYLPKTVRRVYRNNKGEITRTSEITIETIGLNKPLPEDTFSIKSLGLEEDTLVSDNIKKAEFRYRKGNLVPLVQDN